MKKMIQKNIFHKDLHNRLKKKTIERKKKKFLQGRDSKLYLKTKYILSKYGTRKKRTNGTGYSHLVQQKTKKNQMRQLLTSHPQNEQQSR